MFRITIYVENKRLADALMGLVGIAVGTPEVTPVINAVAKRGKVQAIRSDGAPLWQRIGDHLLQNNVESINSTDVKDLLKRFGGSPNSFSYLLALLRKNGFIGKHMGDKRNGYYLVRLPKTPRTSGRIGDNA